MGVWPRIGVSLLLARTENHCPRAIVAAVGHERDGNVINEALKNKDVLIIQLVVLKKV